MRRDHPRSRGEYYLGPQEDNQYLGSSPLSRGIPRGSGWGPRGSGIIPALAGNTGSGWTCTVTRSDHPRSRGEYGCEILHGCQETGSSPLSRGIPPHVTIMRKPERIIPALAGNTMILSREVPSSTDHPRSRGEYSWTSPGRPSAPGSSPLSRGIPHIRRLLVLPARIIPALAGNTHSEGLWKEKRWDHPRSRGEYVTLTVTNIDLEGSSPLSRGIHRRQSVRQRRARIIPALAGNTG